MHLYLGKIFLLLLISTFLSASVQLVSPSYFMEGEVLEFQIIAKGFKVHISPISKIDGYFLDTIKTSKEAVLIHTRKATKLTKTYQVFAKKDIMIPSFEVLIDGKLQKTKPKKILLKKISKTLSKHFDLQMYLNKTTAYVGEELVLKLMFFYQDIEDYELPELKFSGFLVKELDSKEGKDTRGYFFEELSYSLIPQKEGNLSLPAMKAKVEVLKEGFKQLNNRSKYIKKISVYSNSLYLNIHAVPQNISVIGEYKLRAKINKDRVKVGEAVILTLSLEGEGNINNLNAFSLKIPGTTIYNKESIRDEDNNRITKSFEIICEKDFSIPSFRLEYFDIKEHKGKMIHTQAFDIKLLNAALDSKILKRSEDTIIKQKQSKEKINKMEKLMFFCIGVLSTLVLIMGYKAGKKKMNEREEPSLIRRIKQTKDQESLFKKVVPHLGKDRALDRLIYELEEKKSSNFQAIKKEIIQRMKLVLS